MRVVSLACPRLDMPIILRYEHTYINLLKIIFFIKNCRMSTKFLRAMLIFFDYFQIRLMLWNDSSPQVLCS